MIDQTELPSNTDNSIRGEVVLGFKDPRLMSEVEFNSFPDLLYHGAREEFIYSTLNEFDREKAIGSEDFGAGFYLTDDQTQARNYSIVRTSQRHIRPDPIVYSFRPYQARMLDVRSIADPFQNGNLPRSFVDEWLKYLEGFLNDDNNFSEYNEFLKEVYQEGTRQDFLERVQKAFNENKPIYIRDSILPDRGSIFKKGGNGKIAGTFRDFMLSIGYDGMIYREGGEGQAAEDLTGYVFYNPRAVDTWEGWQKRKEVT